MLKSKIKNRIKTIIYFSRIKKRRREVFYTFIPEVWNMIVDSNFDVNTKNEYLNKLQEIQLQLTLYFLDYCVCRDSSSSLKQIRNEK